MSALSALFISRWYIFALLSQPFVSVGELHCADPERGGVVDFLDRLKAEWQENPAAQQEFDKVNEAYEHACDVSKLDQWHYAAADLWKTGGITEKKFICSAKAEPEPFDARLKWPGCIADSMSQGECGACYAWAVGLSMSDRLCIRAKATIKNLEKIKAASSPT